MRDCPMCGGDVVQTPGPGRLRVYCGELCTKRASFMRKSAAKQAARQEMAGPCRACGGPIEVKVRGPVPVVCSKPCREVLDGRRRLNPLPTQACALPECGESFTPFHDYQRCCSERHGKILYNRESRADGRQSSDPWSDRRRDNYHRRRALKKSASTGGPVRFGEIASRDAWRCHICSESVPTTESWPHPLSPSLDHVIPLSKGGAHDPSNVRLAHLACNTSKGSRIQSA